MGFYSETSHHYWGRTRTNNLCHWQHLLQILRSPAPHSAVSLSVSKVTWKSFSAVAQPPVLSTMFRKPIYQQSYSWKLYDSYGKKMDTRYIWVSLHQNLQTRPTALKDNTSRETSPSGSLDVTLGVHNPLLRTVLLNLYIHQNLLETLWKQRLLGLSTPRVPETAGQGVGSEHLRFSWIPRSNTENHCLTGTEFTKTNGDKSWDFGEGREKQVKKVF